MSKNDYIKILREVQNEMKAIVIDFNEYDDTLDFSQLTKELEIDKKKHMYVIIADLLFIICMHNTEFSDVFLNLLVMILVSSLFGLVATSKEEKELIDAYDTLVNITNKCELEISKIEKCIDFFLETSEEDLNKYLSYKIN